QTGTGEWLLADAQFQNWLSSSGGVLWCRGIRASMVVHHLRDEVQAHTNDIGVACIYLDHKDTEAQTIRDLPASLWKELVVDKPMPTTVHKPHDHHRKRGTSPALNDVLQILHSIIAEYSKIYVVLDALDECPELKRDVLLEHLSKAMEGTAVNLFLTSRPHITLHPYFPDTQTLDIRANTGDLYQFVDEYISKSRNLSKHIRTRPELWEEIRTKIISESDGMFLVPKLHLDYLNQKKTVKALRDALQQSPKSLTNLYDQAIERIQSDENEDNRNVARLALIWLANAKRLLSVAELREALAVERGARFLDPENVLDIGDVISACAGLIIEETPHIRLVHPTTQEYLDSIQATQFPDAQLIIASTCLTYLSFDSSNLRGQEGDRRMRKWGEFSSFLSYTPYCLIHAVGEPELILYDEIKEFLKHGRKWMGNFGPPPWNYLNLPGLFSPLWIAAASNLTKVFSKLFAEDPLSLNETIEGRSMLSAAAHYGHLDMVRLLVDDFGVDVNAPCRSPGLYAASCRGHEPVVRFLLDHGAEPDIVGDFRETALHAAARYGHISVIDTLCRHGAGVNARGKTGDTPLGMASQYGTIEAVQRLLKYGADVNQVAFVAIAYAAYAGYFEVIRLLVGNGINTRLQGPSYGTGTTVLHAAWTGERENIFRFLLDNGADVNAGGLGDTILHVLCSTRENHSFSPSLEELVGLLIDKGANVNVEGGSNGTPLGCAAYAGRENICRILIERGAKANLGWTDKDGISCNALWLAVSKGHIGCFNLLRHHGRSEKSGQPKGFALQERR
ncbi:ankyrin repeat-containing domain protein, partial [Mycena galopus ATCC 62051]